MKLAAMKTMKHCENYNVDREKVHCYQRNVDGCCVSSEGALKVALCLNLSAFFKICFCYVSLYNKSINEWALGEQWILFPSNLNVFLNFVSGNIEIIVKQNSLFPPGPVITRQIFLYGNLLSHENDNNVFANDWAIILHHDYGNKW